MEDSVQEILLNELQLRTHKNSAYSLRAFARDLSLTPSHLSSLLKKKAGISKEKAIKIAKTLNLSAEQKKIFVGLAESQFGRNEVQRKQAFDQLQKIQTKYKSNEVVDADLFTLISDWFHFAILELCYVKNFKAIPSWIASRLAITAVQAEEAISRLLKYKLIKFQNNQLVPTQDFSVVKGDIPLTSIRKFHSSMIQMGLASIETQNIEQRCLRSSFLAIRKDKLKEAFDYIAQFHENFCEKIGENAQFSYEKDEVYALSTQFFQISRSDDSVKGSNE